MHLPLLVASAVRAAAIVAEAILFSGCSAVRTAPGLVDEALAGEELLLASAKGEVQAAIRACLGFVGLIHG